MQRNFTLPSKRPTSPRDMNAKPLTHAPPSLAEQAYDRIEAMIVTLELPPGLVFSEAELSQQLGIGRTPTREALQRLVADRLVIALPRRGMMISEVNIAEQLTLLETRRVLDRLIVTRAARLTNEGQRQRLQTLAAAIRDAARAGDLATFMHLDRECDSILESAARNPFAVRAGAPLHAHCRRFWYYFQQTGDLPEAAGLHGNLIDAVAAGDDTAAAEASDRLIDHLEVFTRAALERF